MPGATSVTSEYEAIPFLATPERAHIVSHLFRSIAQQDHLFPDSALTCATNCGNCDVCEARYRYVCFKLAAPDTRLWEVWSSTSDLPVGMVYLTDIRFGIDAVAHYVFFDHKLRDKTNMMNAMLAWAFLPHPDWRPLNRLTVEVPEHYHALARHAQRLGFGGQFSYQKVSVEGVKRAAFRKHGHNWSVLVMGRINEKAI